MENANNKKTHVFKNALSSLALFVRTLPSNDEDNKIEDIDNLSSFSKEDQDTIRDLWKVEAQLKKAAANSGSSKKGLQKQLEQQAHGGRTTIMKTVIRNEKDERIRG